MYYYLLENFIPVQSLHSKSPGELHNADITFSMIRQKLTLEQYEMAQELFEQSKRGVTTISQDKLKYVLGMDVAFGIMVEALKHKNDAAKGRSLRPQQTRTRITTDDQYVYKDEPSASNRTPEQERQRELDLNVRDMIVDRKLCSIATTPKELVKQMRKAYALKSFAGLEMIMKAVEACVEVEQEA